MKFLIILIFLIWGWSVHSEINRDLNSSVLVAYQDLDSSLLVAYKANQNNRLVQSLDSDSSNDLFVFDGDMRFRYMNRFKPDLRQGFQLRARAGFEGHISPRLGWGFKLASGGRGDGNNSPFMIGNYDQDQMVGGFNGKLIWLSGAYFSYTPFNNAILKVGKLDRSPFLDSFRYNPLWDEDLAPEGISAHYKKSIQNRYTFDFKTSWFFINPVISLTASESEKTGTDGQWFDVFDVDNKGMFSLSAQVLMANHDYDLRMGGSHHRVQTKKEYSRTSRNSTQDIQPSTEEKGEESSKTGPKKELMYDYSVLDLFVQMNIKNIRIYPIPLAVSVQLTQNFGAESNFTDTESFGVVVGGVLGHSRRAGHLNFSYNYFRLPKDVTLSHFIDSDIGGTGYAGHQAAIRYFINKDMAFDIKYIMKVDAVGEESLISHQGFVSVLIHI